MKNLTIDDFKLNEHKFTSEVNGAEKDNVLRFYKSKKDLYGEEVIISFDPDKINRSLDSYLKMINTCIEWIEKEENKILNYIADQLVETKNKRWRKWYEFKISKDKFIERIKLKDLVFKFDGSFSLHFDDDNIFYGHTIDLRIENDLNFQEVCIAG